MARPGTLGPGGNLRWSTMNHPPTTSGGRARATAWLVALLAASALPGCQKKAPEAAKATATPEPATATPEPAPAAEQAARQPKENAVKGPIIDHDVETLSGEAVSLASYRGKALLIVNTASQCGFTPQYADLQKLYERYKGRGLEVLAFPSNDFGGQEPGSPDEIRAFVDGEFSVTFPMFAKVHAKGDKKSPLYRTLTEETSGDLEGEVRWNFTKFVVDPDGRPVARFGSMTSPLDDDVIAAVEKALPRDAAAP